MPYSIPFDIPSWTYEQALDALHAALRFGIEPLIETVEDMLTELGDPDLTFSALQIAGTNGKTSTSRYTAAILRAEAVKEQRIREGVEVALLLNQGGQAVDPFPKVCVPAGNVDAVCAGEVI